MLALPYSHLVKNIDVNKEFICVLNYKLLCLRVRPFAVTRYKSFVPVDITPEFIK